MTLLVHGPGWCRHGVQRRYGYGSLDDCPEEKEMSLMPHPGIPCNHANAIFSYAMDGWTCAQCNQFFPASGMYNNVGGHAIQWDSPASPSVSGPSPSPSHFVFHQNLANGLVVRHRSDETCPYCQSASQSLPVVESLPDVHNEKGHCRVDRVWIAATTCPRCYGQYFAPKKATAPIVGFRGWKVAEQVKFVKLTPFSKPRKTLVGVQLNAAAVSGSWNGREKVQAICNNGHSRASHHVPKFSCACGFYIYKQPDFMDYGGNVGEVQGAVVAWGKLIEYAEGFRAEWAQPIFIFEAKDNIRKDFARNVANALQLPLVPFDKEKVARVAKEYGDMMP